jgi:hypothetical protein
MKQPLPKIKRLYSSIQQKYNSMKKLFLLSTALILSATLSTSIAQSTNSSTNEQKEVIVKKEGEHSTTVTPSDIKPIRMEAVKLQVTPAQRITPVNIEKTMPTKEEELPSTPPNQK